MQISHFNIYDQPDEREKKYCEQFGYVSMLMANKSTHSQAPLSYLNLIIAPAIYQENIKFYFNEDGNAVGYVVWAMLAADVERQVIKRRQLVDCRFPCSIRQHTICSSRFTR
jgi:hemolysin-activating ACP:hemolysin acyltransferase